MELDYTRAAGRIAQMVALGGLIILSGCGRPEGSSGEEGKINTALLQVLTSNRRSICVDSKTYGTPLAVFRAMLPAPDPARRPLFWSTPGPLDSGRLLTTRELVNVEFREEQVVLPERLQAAGRLTFAAQSQLNALAREASVLPPQSGIYLAATPEAPRAKVRWWVLNRFDRDCGPAYTVSKPVLMRDLAFVSVTAAHQGSTYAFHKTNAQWAPVAKWSTWLY